MDHPELDYICIRGFKSIRDVNKLRLGAISILIGANGSGKSNLLEVFSFLQAIREGRLQFYVGKSGFAENILHFGSKVTDKIQLLVSFENEKNQYNVTLQSSFNDSLFPSQETVSYWNKLEYTRPYDTQLIFNGRESGLSDVRQTRNNVANWVCLKMDRWRRYHFHDTSSMSPMKKSSRIGENSFLHPDGSNLAAFLYLLKQNYLDSYSMICRTVQRVAPFIEDFRLEPAQLNPDMIQLEWIHKESDKYFGAASLSDGTLRFIALATLFLQPVNFLPSVIILDEPELGLHPAAIVILSSLMKIASQKAQVLVATQSSLLLDNFEPEQVIVAERIDGATQFRQLDANKLVDWLKEYSLGQLWEKNELGGRPSQE